MRRAGEQLRDEITRDHEEHIHAHVAAAESGDFGVIEDHGQNRDRSQAVDISSVRHEANRSLNRVPALSR